MSVTLTTDATVPASTSITLTVYEDRTGDGNADNQDSQSVGNGTNQYSLTSLENGGVDYWLDVSIDNTDAESTAELNSVSLDVTVVEPPSGLTESTGLTSADLECTDESDNEDEFRFYRSTSPGVTTSDTLAGTVPTSNEAGTGGTVAFEDTGLSEDTTYHYAATAYNSDDDVESELSNEVSATTNVQEESAPSNEAAATTTLPAPSIDTVTVTNGDQLRVQGTDNSSNEDGHRVYTRPTGGSGWTQQSGDLPAGDTDFTTPSLLDGEQYDVKLEAFTEDATSDDVLSPAATTDLPDAQQPTLGNGVEDEIAVSIPDDTDYGDYRVQTRETGESAWDGSAVGFDEQVLPSDSDNSGTVDTTVTGREDGEEYEVRVRTETEHVTGDWTTPVSITTKFPAATSLTATNVSETRNDLTWTDNADNEDGFRVLRARDYGQDGSFGSFSQVGSDLAPNTTSFNDTTASPGNTYRYKVRAFTEHTTADSNTDDATTDSAPEPRDKEIPADGYYLEVDHPDGGTIRPSVVDNNARYLPTLLGKPEAIIPVPRDEAWLNDKWEEQPLRLWKDGLQLEIDEIDRVDTTPGATVIRAVGATELDTTVTDYVQEEEAHQKAEDLITDNTTYSANVDDPQADITGDVLIQEADSNAEWESILEAYPPAADDVWYVENGRVKTRQTCFFREAEDYDRDYNSNVVISDSPGDWSGDQNGQVIDIQSGLDDVEWDFTPEHDWANNNVGIRMRFQFHSDNQPQFRVEFDGEIIEQFNRNVFDTNETTPAWQLLQNGNFTADVSAGQTYTLKIFPGAVYRDDDGFLDNDGNNLDDEGVGPEEHFYIDCVAFEDDRHNHNFSESVTNDGVIAGPEEYPQSVVLETTDAVSAEQIVSGSLDSSWSDTSNQQRVRISNDQGANWLSEDNSETVSGSFASGSGTVRAEFRLGRHTSDPSTSPGNGDSGQEVDLFALDVDLDDTPLLVNKNFEASLEDVLNRVAVVSGQIWEARRLPDGTTQIEWTTPGQRTSNEGVAITDFEVSKTNMRPYDLVRVKGASKSRTQAFTSDYDTAVALDRDDVLEGSESVYDTSTDEAFEEGTDYQMDYQSGEITVLSGGNMSDSTKYNVAYDWETRGEHPTSGVPSDPRILTVNVSEATGERECGQLALSIYKDVQSPRYEGKITVDRIDAGTSLVDDIAFEGLPADQRYRIQRFQHTPDSVVGWLETRKPTDQVVREVKRRVDSIVGST